MTDIREYLKEHVLLFDGGMGTFYAARNRNGQTACETANLAAPEEIETIHRLYLDAGCRAVKTNTFSVNRRNFSAAECADLIRAGYEIACRAAGENAYVFADVGPLEEDGAEDPAGEYAFVADLFLRQGASHFLFETNASDRGLAQVAQRIKAARPDAFILVSFAVQPDGFTREGLEAGELLRRAAADDNIDAVGLNCVSSAPHMAKVARTLGPVGKIFSAMPNAGYPTVRGSRTFYDGDPTYFAQQTLLLRDLGARILGGCCGTTPEHIKALAGMLRLPRKKVPAPAPRVTIRERAPYAEDPFWNDLCREDRRPFAVELDPPEDADLTKFMAGAKELRDAGADVITIADCPIARARIDSSLMACKLKRELGVGVIPHMTCRDRNLNAAQALLLGLCAEGIGNVLIVTGDPIPSQRRDEVKSVYNFNSRKLIAYVEHLGRMGLPTSFRPFAALNVNAVNFSIALDLAREKEDNGAVGFFTQPILTERAAENLALAKKTLRGKILGGIMPIVSHRNALFLRSEIAGIAVDDRIVAAYEGLDREQGEDLAVRISVDVAKRIASDVDGYYLVTPFGRAGLMARIMKTIRETGL